MGRKDQIISERLRKLKELKESGINPYPHKFDKKDYAGDLQEKYRGLAKGKKSGKA